MIIDPFSGQLLLEKLSREVTKTEEEIKSKFDYEFTSV